MEIDLFFVDLFYYYMKLMVFDRVKIWINLEGSVKWVVSYVWIDLNFFLKIKKLFVLRKFCLKDENELKVKVEIVCICFWKCFLKMLGFFIIRLFFFLFLYERISWDLYKG